MFTHSIGQHEWETMMLYIPSKPLPHTEAKYFRGGDFTVLTQLPDSTTTASLRMHIFKTLLRVTSTYISVFPST